MTELKCGDRNLRAEMRQTLRDFFEAKGVEFVTAEPDDDEDEAPVETFPTRKAVDGFAVLPTPTFAIGIAPDLPAADRTAALRELDAIVRENDRQLPLTAAYEDVLFFDPALSDGAKAVNEELRQGLAYEAILRRVLAGSSRPAMPKGRPQLMPI